MLGWRNHGGQEAWFDLKKKSILNWGFVVYFTIVLKLADEKQKKLVSHTVLLKISPFFRCIWICTTPKGVLVFFQRQSCVVLKTTFFFAVAFCVTVWTFLLSCSYGVWLFFPSRIKCGVSTSMMHSFDVFFLLFSFSWLFLCWAGSTNAVFRLLVIWICCLDIYYLLCFFAQLPLLPVRHSGLVENHEIDLPSRAPFGWREKHLECKWWN